MQHVLCNNTTHSHKRGQLSSLPQSQQQVLYGYHAPHICIPGNTILSCFSVFIHILHSSSFVLFFHTQVSSHSPPFSSPSFLHCSSLTGSLTTFTIPSIHHILRYPHSLSSSSSYRIFIVFICFSSHCSTTLIIPSALHQVHELGTHPMVQVYARQPGVYR